MKKKSLLLRFAVLVTAMMCTLGMLSGEFLSGAMADFMDKRMVLLCFAVLEFSAAWFFMYRKRKQVSEVYNRET